MQRTALLSIILGVACGGQSGEAPPTVHVAAAPTASAPAPEPPLAALGVPRGAPLVVTFDLGAMVSVFGAARGELEHELGLSPGALSGDLSELGVDPKRPVVVALAPLDADEESAVDALAAIAPDAANGQQIVDTYLRAKLPLESAMRVVVPAVHPRDLAKTLGSLVARAGWTSAGRGYTKPHQILEITAGASSVALDLAGAREPKTAFDALERVMSASREPLPRLEGALHATWVPASYARLGFLMGMTKVVGAISGESVDASQRARIAAEGSSEASSLFALAGPKGHPTFERVDVSARLEPFAITVRAHPGAGFSMPPTGAFAPSASVSIASARSELGGAVALMRGWPFPADVVTLARNGGLAAIFVGLPQLLAEAPRDLPRASHEAAPGDEMLGRFERAGQAWTPSGGAIWFGVLPQKTTRAAAQCSLAQDGRCTGAAKLPVGKTTKAGHGFAKVIELDRRWVLLLSKDAAALDAKVTLGSAGPLHLDAETKDLWGELHASGALPAHVTGDLAADGTDVVFRLAGK